uniref:Uncharacterized protein n=1 Tax=Arundo donax TaxID=35708 RepID=A0A0A9D8I9_ARUDO
MEYHKKNPSVDGAILLQGSLQLCQKAFDWNEALLESPSEALLALILSLLQACKQLSSSSASLH